MSDLVFPSIFYCLFSTIKEFKKSKCEVHGPKLIHCQGAVIIAAINTISCESLHCLFFTPAQRGMGDVKVDSVRQVL